MILSEATHELLVGQRRQNLLKINFEDLSTLYLNDFLINFLMILSEATLALLVEHGLIISRKSISKIYKLSI